MDPRKSQILADAGRAKGSHGAPGGSVAIARANDAVSAGGETLRVSPLEWLLAVVAAVVQQGAFVSVPMVLAGSMVSSTTMSESPDPYNTFAVAACGLAVGALCVMHRHRLITVVRENRASALLVIIVVASTLWSSHPDITFRRGSGYVITMMTAAYISSRFTIDQVMKVLSWSIALAGAGSFVFVAAFPQYGIMQEPSLVGSWRGVFAHKNELGSVMAVGVFVECYLLAHSWARNRRHLALLGCFCALVVLSRSATWSLCATYYLAGACIYVLWFLDRRIFVIALTTLALLGLVAGAVIWANPDFGFASLGKDATLTGRTGLWPWVLELIWQKPLLGWGYGAAWIPSDSAFIRVSKAVGWFPDEAHDELLEVALELGLLGVAVVSVIVLVMLWRGASSIARGRHQLGVFSLLFAFATLVSGITENVLVVNQQISWLVFNILIFCAGPEITLLKARQSPRN